MKLGRIFALESDFWVFFSIIFWIGTQVGCGLFAKDILHASNLQILGAIFFGWVTGLLPIGIIGCLLNIRSRGKYPGLYK